MDDALVALALALFANAVIFTQAFPPVFYDGVGVSMRCWSCVCW